MIENGLRMFEACFYFLAGSSTAEDKKCAISAQLQKHKEFDVDGIHHCLTYGDWEEFFAAFSNAPHLEPACLEVPQDKSLSLT